jgi:hypothetical protein
LFPEDAQSDFPYCTDSEVHLLLTQVGVGVTLEGIRRREMLTIFPIKISAMKMERK